MRSSVSALIIALVVLPTPSSGASFIGLGSLGDVPGGMFLSTANGVSGDGTTVVGYVHSGDGPAAFRWTPGDGMTAFDIGDYQNSIAYGTSFDGSVSVGSVSVMVTPTESQSEPARWTLEEGFSGLGNLAGGPDEGGALSVSADGSVVVGSSGWGPNPEAFRWSEETGLVGLGDLPGGVVESSASGVSADGSVVVGYGFGFAGREAFRWTAAEGMVGLGGLDPTGIVNLHSEAAAASSDGSIIVGSSLSISGPEAFRWTRDGGMVGLGDLEGGVFASGANGVSGDGAVVVGSGIGGGTQYEPSIRKAFVWTETNGMHDLAVLLTSLGVDVQGWRLVTANDVSRDGRTIVGTGINPNGQTEAWIAVIPEPSSALLMGLGLAGLAARGARQR